MADNENPKIRYDDFISSVQPDPAKPESTIMLSGFIGHGAEGHVRVYPDPTLGTWYDIPEGDVVHSLPIADSKLGGSYVWARASAEIKPGSAAATTTEAPQQAPQADAAANPTPATHCFVCDPPKAAAAMQPTPTVQTHCFICPPPTQNCTPATVCTHAIHCPSAPVVCNTMPTPATVCTHAIHCPSAPVVCNTMPTPATVCTHAIHCPSAPVVCDTMQMPTPATRCFICPPPHNQSTVATVCTLPPGCPQPGFTLFCGVLPPSFGCTQQGCQQGGAQQQEAVAPRAMAAPQGQAPQGLHTSWFDCHTNMPGCTVHVCAQGVGGLGPNQHTVGGAAITQCCPPTHFHCPPQQTLATICTQIGCPTHQIFCPTQPVVCNLMPTQPVVCGVLPPSFGCTQQGCGHGGQAAAFEGATVVCSQPARCTQACMPQAQQQPEAVMAAPAHPNTAATLCTQHPACPPHTVHNSICICPTPSAVHQCGGPVHPTLATVCTLPPGCPMPQFTVFGACPTFGVCPSIACTFTPMQNGVFTPFGR
jgi:hypothetical protein